MNACPPAAVLQDRFARKIEYVRLSVIDRCDLRCFYCIPKGFHNFAQRVDWLDFTETERIIRIFGELGVNRVRLTGGEPLLRKGVAELAARLAALPGITDLSLSTNGTHLGKYAQSLKNAGISRVNVSLDSLQPERFHEITGGALQPVLDGLRIASAVGLAPIKINMVVMKGRNDDEVVDMVEYCLENNFTLRFIEAMPVGDTGRAANQHYLDLAAVRERLARHYPLLPGIMPGGGPARYARIAGTDLHIGFITPISRHFCETCNRVRLSVEGTLFPCLGQENEVSLRDAMRQGADDEALRQLIRHAIQNKPERHDFQTQPEKIQRVMAQTGG